MNNNNQNIPIAADKKSESFGDEYLKIFQNLADSAIDASPSEDEAIILFMQMAAHSLAFLFELNPSKFPKLLSIILAAISHSGESSEDTDLKKEHL